MKNTKILEVEDSSIIYKIGYNHKAKALTVMLKNGNIYQYDNVPVLVARDFAAADSKGQYYNNNIKDKYESQKAS